MLEWFAAYQNANPRSPLYKNALTIHSSGPVRMGHAKNNKLPTVSWIVPTSGQSEHPAYIPASGANYLASKLEAVASNLDLWSKTVFIVNYDENDGLFDHVVPPLPPPGTPNEFIDGLPIGGGVRVPCFVISPWSVGGFVATENFDHTSVLRFLERLTGVIETNVIGLAAPDVRGSHLRARVHGWPTRASAAAAVDDRPVLDGRDRGRDVAARELPGREADVPSAVQEAADHPVLTPGDAGRGERLGAAAGND